MLSPGAVLGEILGLYEDLLRLMDLEWNRDPLILLITIPCTIPMATPSSILDRINKITPLRDALVKLLDEPNLGTLRIDVNQALEEFDDLMEELEQTFPKTSA